MFFKNYKAWRETDQQNAQTKRQKRNQNAFWRCKSTATPHLQLNHTTQSQSRTARLKPVYRHPRPKNKNHQHQNRFSYT